MKVGYMRVSTGDQNLSLQRDALEEAGCERTFEDVASGASENRKGLADCLGFLREGDVLTVWKLDRLGRSLKHLVEIVTFLQTRKIGFRSLSEGIDTTSDAGRLTFHIFASLAEFERSLIGERTKAGLAAARARGRKGGRPSVVDKEKLRMARTLMADTRNSVAEVCRILKLSKTTLYRHLKQENL